MRLAGRTDVPQGAALAIVELPADQKYALRIHLTQSGNLSKVSVYMDGLGAGAGAQQVCRALLYSSADVLLATSDEVTVLDAQAPGWVDFRFSTLNGGLVLPAADYYVAVHSGGLANIARIYRSAAAHNAGGKWNADTYSDGASASFGAATGLTTDFAAYVTHFAPYVRPVETDLYYSRLPLPDAQTALDAGVGSIVGSARLVDVGWHDTFIDPEVGSVALVRSGGEFEYLLGERIRLTTQDIAVPRTVVAYVHNLADEDAFDWDISLSRTLFARMGSLASDTERMIVGILG